MGVLVGGGQVTTAPTKGLGRIVALHSTGLALTKKEASQSDFRNQKGMEWRGWTKKTKTLTCRSDPDCLLAVVDKRSYGIDRSNMLG